jgi:hypothetical protein
MHNPALVRDHTIASNKDIVRNCLTEDLDLEHIRDDLLCLSVNVGVDEGDIVVAGDDVSEGG